MAASTDARTPWRPAKAVAIAWAVVSLALVAWSLAGLTIDRTPSAAAGEENLGELAPFWIASGSSWLALSLLWASLRGIDRDERSSRRGFTSGALIVFAVAVAARVAVIATHTPTLSDDLHRYVFDGRNGASGINPYLVRPEERVHALAEGEDEDETDAERWPGERDLAPLINNPELYTLYLPASQWVFIAAGAIVPDAWSSPVASGRLFRTVITGAEIAALVLLALLARRLGRSPWWLALYAWHPLPLAEVAGSGHQDAIGLAFLLAAMLLFALAPAKTARWTVPLAAAVLVKPIVVPVAALFLRGRTGRSWATSAGIGLLACVAIAGPLLLAHGAEPIANARETAERFSLKWAHFGSVYEPLLAAIETVTPDWTNDPQEQLARVICTALLVLIAIAAWARGRNAWTATEAIVLAMVLLSPAAHPWYVLWALVLVPIATSRAVWVASLTLPWGYAALGDPEGWTVPIWVMVAAYAPIYAAIALDLYHARPVQKSAANP